jgi:hypothetical protein
MGTTLSRGKHDVFQVSLSRCVVRQPGPGVDPPTGNGVTADQRFEISITLVVADNFEKLGAIAAENVALDQQICQRRIALFEQLQFQDHGSGPLCAVNLTPTSGYGQGAYQARAQAAIDEGGSEAPEKNVILAQAGIQARLRWNSNFRLGRRLASWTKSTAS